MRLLVHLDHDQASDVLKSFTERQRNEVLIRIATLDGIQPAALKDLNEVLSKVLAGGDRLKKASLGENWMLIAPAGTCTTMQTPDGPGSLTPRRADGFVAQVTNSVRYVSESILRRSLAPVGFMNRCREGERPG